MSRAYPAERSFALRAGLSYATVLAAYYLLKTTREPLVLASGGALLKSASTALQALVLLALLPLYARAAARLPLRRLVLVGGGLLLACIAAFAALAPLRWPALSAAFYVFTGVFGVSAVAQVGALVADATPAQDAARTVPLALLGATVGGIAGSSLAGALYGAGFTAPAVLALAAVLFAVHLALVAALPRGADRADEAPVALADGLSLLRSEKGLALLAGIVLLTNVVNTHGELVLASGVRGAAEQAYLDAVASGVSVPRETFLESTIGASYARFFTGVNVVTVALQLLLAGWLGRRLGPRMLLVVPPLLSLGVYAISAGGVGLALLTLGKTVENASDYSLGATARTLFWVERSGEERVLGKPVIDTLLVRLADLVAAGSVGLGTYLGLGSVGFSWINVALSLAAVVACGVLATRRGLARSRDADLAPQPRADRFALPSRSPGSTS